MENGSGSWEANGFKAMSQNADIASNGHTGDQREGVASNLKSFGVDTDQMTELAGERVSELQQLLIDEIKARPLRALGWAAAAGVVFGIWAAR